MSAAPSKATPRRPAAPTLRGRIGRDERSGYYAAPRRYRLHLSKSCPHCLRIAITRDLLGLEQALPVVWLPAVPDTPDGGHVALRPLYESSAHQYPGPTSAPVLSDDWTGRIVSNHAPDILRDMALHFGARQGGRDHRDGPTLHPRGAARESEAVERLCEQGVVEAARRAGQVGVAAAECRVALDTLFRALGTLEGQLARTEFVLGDAITAADVTLWVTLVQLDAVHRLHLDAAAVHRVADHPHLWAYARGLAAHPAFGGHLDLDALARRHHAHGAGLEAAGAAAQVLDRSSPIADGAARIHQQGPTDPADPRQVLQLRSPDPDPDPDRAETV